MYAPLAPEAPRHALWQLDRRRVWIGAVNDGVASRDGDDDGAFDFRRDGFGSLARAKLAAVEHAHLGEFARVERLPERTDRGDRRALLAEVENGAERVCQLAEVGALFGGESHAGDGRVGEERWGETRPLRVGS